MWATAWSAAAWALVAMAALFDPLAGQSIATVAGLAMVSLACFVFATIQADRPAMTTLLATGPASGTVLATRPASGTVPDVSLDPSADVGPARGAGLAQPWAADLGILWALAALGAFLTLTTSTAGTASAVLAGVSAACALSLLLVRNERSQGGRPLVRRVALVGAVTCCGSLVLAGTAGVPSAALVLALAVAAMQAAALGTVAHSTLVQQLAPPLGCASALTWMQLAAAGDPLLKASAVGLTLLLMVELWRHGRARAGGNVAADEIIALEALGLVLLAGPALVKATSAGLHYAILGILIGVGIGGWGLLTRVRRRLLTAAAVVLASAVILVAVPAVALVPAIQGAWTWVLIAVVGVLALLVASLLEQGRSALRRGVAMFKSATAGWE
jgi:hypothetical protein